MSMKKTWKVSKVGVKRLLNQCGPMSKSVNSMSNLGAVDPNFKCVMVVPKKPIIHKRIKYTIKVKGQWVEGFSRDKKGKDHPNGIRFFVTDPGQFIPPGATITFPRKKRRS
jgi:hypothetical protein